MLKWFKKKNKEYTIFRQLIEPDKARVNPNPFLPEGYAHKSRESAERQLSLEKKMGLNSKLFKAFIIRTK